MHTNSRAEFTPQGGVSFGGVRITPKGSYFKSHDGVNIVELFFAELF